MYVCSLDLLNFGLTLYVICCTKFSISDSSLITKSYCESIAQKITSLQDFPVACQQYDDVYEKLEKKIARSADPFYGMDPGTAIKARATRAAGLESHHQIQRRQTTPRRFSKLDKK